MPSYHKNIYFNYLIVTLLHVKLHIYKVSIFCPFQISKYLLHGTESVK